MVRVNASGKPLPTNPGKANAKLSTLYSFTFNFFILLFLELIKFASEPDNALTLFCLPFFPPFQGLSNAKATSLVTLNHLFCFFYYYLCQTLLGSAGFIFPLPINCLYTAWLVI